MSSTGKICTAARIFYSICGEWMGLMSGSFSVLFTAAAFHFQGHDRRLFVILAFGALWICVLRLAYKNYPKFKVDCSKEIELCATPQNTTVARYFRVRVSTKWVNAIEECSGNLEKIEKDGVVVFEGDATVLPFSKPEDRRDVSIIMKPDVNYWLDILAVIVHRFTEEELQGLRATNWTHVPFPNRPDRVWIATKPPYVPPNNTKGQYVFL